MKILFFNREAARQGYLKRYVRLREDKRRLELLLLRGEALAKNQLFTKELLEYEGSPKNEEMRRNFVRRWGVNPNTHLYAYAEPDGEFAAAKVDGANITDGTIRIKIDLRYSKKRIMREVEYLVKDWQGELFERIECHHEADELPYWKDKPRPREGNIKSDLNDYWRYFDVWMLREIGEKSWREIQKKLNLNSWQTARNWYNVACEIITEGVPSLPPFPQQ
jgi:hypothetical protein